MKKILITGGLGFQGIHVAMALLDRGHHVTLLNTPSERARLVMLPALLQGINSRLLVDIVFSSVTDAETLEKVMPGHDAVIHMAAWASVDQSLDRPWPPWEVNATGTLAVLDAVRRFACPRTKVIIASSCEVYGPVQDGQVQDETTVLLPRSPYAASKIAADRMAYAYAVTYDMDIIILRPSNIYGSWQRAGSFGAVIPTFVTAALRGEPLVITGGGRQSREFLNVEDLAGAYVLAVESTPVRAGDAFNVGSGEILTIHDLAMLVCEFVPGSRIVYSDARVADVSGFQLNSEKFRRTFGWDSTIAFHKGLWAYINWARLASMGVLA